MSQLVQFPASAVSDSAMCLQSWLATTYLTLLSIVVVVVVVVVVDPPMSLNSIGRVYPSDDAMQHRHQQHQKLSNTPIDKCRNWA